ncbi:tyrosine-type recombinase/integrase [Piscibacillus sp. B03]|uniref:tyrosine-type recombinase/integrase n=1 Tax=Piscibacillus sp. B03 TaxID=3457430 RepID=UPI003FCC2903
MSKVRFQKYNYSRGVYKTSIHAFRHTYAKNYIQQGGSSLKLQRLLGHSTLDITQKYVNLYSNDLKEGYDDVSILNKLNKKNNGFNRKR